MSGPVAVWGPAGEKTWIDLSDNIRTVQQLRQKAVKELPLSPGQSEDVRLTLDGKTLDDSTPLSHCKFLPRSVIHLVLRVHGG